MVSISTSSKFLLLASFAVLMIGAGSVSWALFGLNRSWRTYQEQVSSRQALRAVLTSQMGFGGLTDDFRNFLISGQEEHLKGFYESKRMLGLTLSAYRVLALAADEHESLDAVASVVAEYSLQVERLRADPSGGHLETATETIGLVNNAPALAGFAQLDVVLRDLGTQMSQRMSESVDRLLLLLLVVFGLVGAFAAISTRLLERTANNLRRVATAIADLAQGVYEPDARLPVSTTDEIGQLRRAYNRLLHGMGELEARADEIASGHLDAIATIGVKNNSAKGIAVSGTLADSFRRMVVSLRAAREQVAEEQAKLRQSEKLASLGQIAAGIAHEVNNPLHGVMGCVKALSLGTVPGEREEEYFATCRDGLSRIQRSIRNLLDFARRDTQEPPEEVDASLVVERTALLLFSAIRNKRVTFKQDVRAREVYLWVDPFQVIQALVNIVMNAIHAVDDGGEITISAYYRSGDDGVWNAILAVADDGHGMTPEQVRRVCEPFFSTKERGEGTGLGMAVTAGILKSYGGRCEIQSEPGEGTTVNVVLPAAGRHDPDN